MYSCTTCRLNSMLCERCCLAMAFIFRKPRTPVKSLTSTCPAPGAHSTPELFKFGHLFESFPRAAVRVATSSSDIHSPPVGAGGFWNDNSSLTKFGQCEIDLLVGRTPF